MTFRDLLGHRHVLQRVSRAVARGSLPPSMLFSGPRGVGKAATAVALAQVLNCESLVAGIGEDLALDSCGTCATCRRVAAGKFAELIVLRPDDSGSVKIDTVRDVLGRVGYRPFEGRRRVVLLDDADALQVAAQNALLKTLEEPNPSTVFVLVSSRPDALLATIRSRCPQFRFGPLPAADIARLVQRGQGCSEAEALQRAAAADGSIGRALAEGTDGFAHARDVAEAVLRALARGADERRRLEVAKLLAERGEAPKSSKRGTAAASDRALVGDRLQALAVVLRDVCVMTTRAKASWVANVDRQSVLADLAAAFPAPRALRAFSAVDRARVALERNASPKVVADWLAFQL